MTVTFQLPCGHCVSLDQRSILLGSGADCDVRLPAQEQLRPQHARVRKLATRWLLESQGQWLVQAGQAEPGKECWLQPGDVIRLSPQGPEVVFEPRRAAPSPRPAVPGNGPPLAARQTGPNPPAKQPGGPLGHAVLEWLEEDSPAQGAPVEETGTKPPLSATLAAARLGSPTPGVPMARVVSPSPAVPGSGPVAPARPIPVTPTPAPARPPAPPNQPPTDSPQSSPSGKRQPPPLP